jgi:parallel beta-helix repeat protein
MFLYDSPLNTISGNTITMNRYAIGFDTSPNNLIRGNYFMENELQIYDASEDNPEITISMNTWHVSYPVGGNYWSDYMGIDVKKGSEQNEDGSDFVGDTPYIINAYNQDGYPLIPENSLYVYITGPENKSYNADSLTLTYTVSVDDATIKYSLDEKANVTISGNTKISNLINGSHKVTVFAQDSEGNQASHSVYFTISDQGETPTDQDTDSLSTILIIVAIAAVAGVVILYFLKLRKK